MSFAPLYPIIHRLLKPAFSSCLWSGCERTPAIALTFDDGPHPQHTSQLLKVLDHYQVPSTFFWLGAAVDRAPDLAQEVYQQGHWIGLHGYSHRAFTRMTSTEIRADLERTQHTIAKACAIDPATARDVRPPYGLFTPQIVRLLNQWNYRPVMWSIVPEDWMLPGISVVVRRVVQQVQNGAIVVLHEGSEGGQEVAQIVDRLIPLLLEKGYQFATVDQLWNSRHGTLEPSILTS